VGLGPGFTCGVDADLIVETHRGARLGEVISQGSAAANTGIPGVLGGEAARRVVRSPAAGHLDPRVRIGDMVTAGQVLGHVSGQPVTSKLDGQVRGLIHPGAELSHGDKVGDVDPRGKAIDPRLVSDKALAVAGGVMEALLRWRVFPA
jgi:xanthine dehydrogenase accessory factor